MEKIVERNMLYDFYGELLTPHQQEIYESIIFQDLSLSEVAEIHGISRQGVHDLVRRCDKLLEGYENKLHLVERFVTLKSSVSELRELTKAYETISCLDRLTGFARQYSKSCNCKVKGRKELQKWHLRAYLKSFRTYLKICAARVV